MEGCYFRLLNKCSKTPDDDLSSAGADRIKSIIKACHDRGDELPTDLEAANNADENIRFSVIGTVYRHTVPSTKSGSSLNLQTGHHVNLHHAREPEDVPVRQKECIEANDPKNPSRWHSVSCIRTLQQGEKSLKEAILTACNKRKYTWTQELELRVCDAFSDLHAADGHYHND